MRCCSKALRAVAASALLFAAGAAALAQPAAGADDALASLQSAYAGAVAPGEQADVYRELIGAVVERVRRSYATEVDLAAFAAAARKALESQPRAGAQPAEVFTRAINAALAELDPYSRYLDARMQDHERDLSRGSFVGVGVQVEAADGAVRVVAPMPGTPAARAGLQAGDLIVRVDEQPLHGTPLADAIARMRGEPGTAVSLTIRRSGLADAFTVSLTRETIRRQAVLWSMEGKVLVLRVNAFGTAVSAALRQAVADAAAADTPQAVVLDLRGNPGGLLHEAIRVADTFLHAGEIVSLRGRTGQQRSWQADAAELLAGVPMVVLVDRRSASASELVAAALQDNGRATVMGQRSFGKGTVQTTYSLGEEIRGALKLTSAFYHRPSGASVQRVGVGPDIELLPAPAGEGAGGPAEVAAPQARVDQASCSAVVKSPDPALACALTYLQAGSVERFVARLAAPRP
jgi:carboxyl-terminal processing protease